MHAIDENGLVCVDLDDFTEISDSIRLRHKIDELMEQCSCPEEIPNFSVSIIFKSGKRFYISNLYYWAIAYRTQGYQRADIDHAIDIYDGKEYFIQDKIPRDETQLAILEVMRSRYKLYTAFAMVRQCYECDVIIEAYQNMPVQNHDEYYSRNYQNFEKFIIAFLDQMIPELTDTLTEYAHLDFFKDKKFRASVISNRQNKILPVLTPRELQCLYLVSQGANPKSIAEQLFLSPDTVTTHIKAIRKKLKCNTITQAVIIAIKNDLFKNTKYPFLGIH
ncbi:lipolytic enzyme / transcription regulator protein [Legionella geestiana]|uniref:Lipolytic enzyme / transcription regulator protein n=1 Tax=Legionella geestiana TaxID=45065 RepID=A0A0W0U338_9GAMM|nr:helix-turn-helix transcriptional regulator [Legionella geestiana]KTD02118.1 lipolytic enzyme / transcription regulator protein [Legionella geestiana]QBS11553.1 LuxR family transcriptional regulator [Legionella geestiana]STX53774.1 lipolytic enzyme / transcription regulator protein [Legionella geestiana]